MNTHEHSEPCNWRDSAWCYVLGSSSEDENEAFHEHLLEGCPACGAELQQARKVVGNLDHAVAQRTVRGGQASVAGPEVRERLLRSISGPTQTPFSSEIERKPTSWLRATDLPGILVARNSEEGWEPAGVEGVEMKALSKDEERRAVTALVRMQPGSSYPSHRHALREECLVLSGDLSFGENRLTAGDFQIAEKDSVHPVQATEKGCLLLVVTSLDDEPCSD